MPTAITYRDGVRKVVHEPGNMTRYVGYACKNPDKPVEWVVSFPEQGFGGCYHFVEGLCVSTGYVIEKIPRRHQAVLGEIDASEIAKVIAMLVPGTTAMVSTDATGRPFAKDEPRLYTPPQQT